VINEITYADAWLQSTLTGDATLMGLLPGGVHSELIPEAATLPALRFHIQATGGDVMSFNSYRIWVRPLYLIAVVHRTKTYNDIRPAADRLDTLLHKVTGQLSPVLILTCYREDTFRMPEIDGDNHYRHLGGLYRLLVQEGV
jgi:hypothetical protein